MTAVVCTAQAGLFGDTAALLPDGLAFTAALVTPAEEAALLAVAAALPLREARYKQYTARRRVHAFGSRFDFGEYRLAPREMDNLPPPLAALRQRLAAWAGVAADDFVHVMVAEYQKGTPLGWHRDAPDYELIAGVSLGAPARLRFRPWPAERQWQDDAVALDLSPRSAYVMQGCARWGWQHSVPPVPGLRYSVTMRTQRAQRT